MSDGWLAPDEKGITGNQAAEPEGERLRRELTDWLERNRICGILMDTLHHSVHVEFGPTLPKEIRSKLTKWGSIYVVVSDEIDWAAPATSAATPMAGNGYETAAVMRDLFREWWDKHDTATKLRKPQEMTAFQRIQNAFYAGALAIMDRQRAVAMNSEAPEKPIAPST